MVYLIYDSRWSSFEYEIAKMGYYTLQRIISNLYYSQSRITPCLPYTSQAFTLCSISQALTSSQDSARNAARVNTRESINRRKSHCRRSQTISNNYHIIAISCQITLFILLSFQYYQKLAITPKQAQFLKWWIFNTNFPKYPDIPR